MSIITQFSDTKGNALECCLESNEVTIRSAPLHEEDYTAPAVVLDKHHLQKLIDLLNQYLQEIK